MKITSTELLIFAAMSLIVIGPLTLRNVYALKDEDGRYISDVRKCQKQSYRSYSIHI